MNWTNKKRLGQLLSSAARQYVTNCQNHITTNLNNRLKKWIKYKLFKIHQFPLPKKHINSIINHFITNLKNRDPPSLPSNIIDKLSTSHPQYLIYLTTRIQYIHSKVQQTLFQNQALDDKSVKHLGGHIFQVSTKSSPPLPSITENVVFVSSHFCLNTLSNKSTY